MVKEGTRHAVLYDLRTDGHHIYHAIYLTRYLGMCGYRVTYITTRQTPEIKLMPDQPGLSIQYTGIHYDDAAEGNLAVKYWQITRSHLQAARSLWRCFRLAREQQADVVHLLYLNGNELPLFVWQLFRRPGARRVFATLVKPYDTTGKGKKAGGLNRFYSHLTIKAAARMLRKGTLEGIFVFNGGIRDALIKRFGPGQRFREGIIFTPDPVNLPESDLTREQAREILGLPANIPVLLFFGLLLKNKGIDVLFEAVRPVKKDFRLVIAGEPGYFTAADIEGYRRKLDDPARVVTRLERIPDAEIPVHFRAADAVVLPYRGDSRGTSGILQLAAAAGRPVIATDAGEVGATVREHGLGIVVAPDSAGALRAGIEEFLAGPEAIAEEVAPRALEYARNSHWTQFAAIIEAAYRADRPPTPQGPPPGPVS